MESEYNQQMETTVSLLFVSVSELAGIILVLNAYLILTLCLLAPADMSLLNLLMIR